MQNTKMLHKINNTAVQLRYVGMQINKLKTGHTCTEVALLLLVPISSIHKAWQLCPGPKHQLKHAFLETEIKC